MIGRTEIRLLSLLRSLLTEATSVQEIILLLSLLRSLLMEATSVQEIKLLRPQDGPCRRDTL